MTAPKDSGYLIPTERLDRGILLTRGQRVMLRVQDRTRAQVDVSVQVLLDQGAGASALDAGLAALFGVSTRALNQAIKRDLDRFPADFLFRLNPEEKAEVVTICDHLSDLKFSRHLPYAFTEHGAVMAATVLNSKRAAEASVFVVRAFVRMRQLLASHRELALKLTDLERRVAAHDTSISSLVSAIRQLLQPPEPKKKRIGFITDDDKPGQTGSGSDFIARDRSRRRTRR